MATHRLVIEGKEYTVEVGFRSGNRVEVFVNGKPYLVQIEAGRPTAVVPRPAAPVAPPAPNRGSPITAGAPGEVRAPIAGLVMRVSVSPGEQVSAGAELLVLEAMKMENQIFAPSDGVVATVAVSVDQHVTEGALLVTLTTS